MAVVGGEWPELAYRPRLRPLPLALKPLGFSPFGPLMGHAATTYTGLVKSADMAITPSCEECGAVWLPADLERVARLSH